MIEIGPNLKEVLEALVVIAIMLIFLNFCAGCSHVPYYSYRACGIDDCGKAAGK